MYLHVRPFPLRRNSRLTYLHVICLTNNQVVEFVKSKDASLVDKLTKNLGFVTGIEFREGSLLLNAKTTATVEKGVVSSSSLLLLLSRESLGGLFSIRSLALLAMLTRLARSLLHGAVEVCVQTENVINGNDHACGRQLKHALC